MHPRQKERSTMRKAIVLGGNADQVPLVQALKGRGYSTVLIDYYPDPPAKAIATVHRQVSTLDVQAVCDAVEEERPAFITSIGNDLVVPVLAEVSERYALPAFQSHADSLKATNKRLMKAAFLEHGIPSAPLIPSQRWYGEARLALPYPLIGKLLVGYGARGVRRLSVAADLDAYLGEFATQGEVLVEAFIADGAELSVDCFAVDGKATVLLVSRLHQVPGLRQGFAVLMTEFPYPLSAEVGAQLDAIAQRMVSAFGVRNGPFFFQAKLKDDAVTVIEMGARIAGGRKFSVVRSATSFDPLEAQLDVLEGRKPKVQLRDSGLFYATAMLFARAGTLASISPPTTGNVHDFFCVKGQGFVSRGTGAGDERIAALTVSGAHRAEALAALRAAVASVDVRDAGGAPMLRTELYDGAW